MFYIVIQTDKLPGKSWERWAVISVGTWYTTSVTMTITIANCRCCCCCWITVMLTTMQMILSRLSWPLYIMMTLPCQAYYTHLGFFRISSSCPTTPETFVRIILKATCSSFTSSCLIRKVWDLPTVDPPPLPVKRNLTQHHFSDRTHLYFDFAGNCFFSSCTRGAQFTTSSLVTWGWNDSSPHYSYLPWWLRLGGGQLQPTSLCSLHYATKLQSASYVMNSPY